MPSAQRSRAGGCLGAGTRPCAAGQDTPPRCPWVRLSGSRPHAHLPCWVSEWRSRAPKTRRSPNCQAPGRQSHALVQGSQLPKDPLSVVCEAIGGLLAFRGSPPPRGCPGCRWGGRHQSGVCSDGWQRVSMANTSPKRFLSETVHTLLPRLSWPLTGGLPWWLSW